MGDGSLGLVYGYGSDKHENKCVYVRMGLDG